MLLSQLFLYYYTFIMTDLSHFPEKIDSLFFRDICPVFSMEGCRNPAKVSYCKNAKIQKSADTNKNSSHEENPN